MSSVNILGGSQRSNWIRVLAAACGIALLCTPALAQSEKTIKDVTVPEIQSIESDKANRSAAQQKVSSQILDALKQQSSGQTAAVPGLKVNSKAAGAPKRGALVDIDAKVTDDLLSSIKKSGGTIVDYYQASNAIRAYVPLENIEGIAARPEVKSISPAAKATTNAVKVDEEGVKSHAADGARSAFNVTGTGIKVGVLSDSIDDGRDSLKKAFAAKHVTKATLSVLPGQAGEGEGEGLAMAEIVHAIAPGAQIIFATGFGSPAGMAENIRALQKAGCKIIVDDVTYFNKSPFQDGIIAQAVNDVSAAGVLYFSSARNSGSKKHGTSGTWEGDFADGGPATGDVSGGAPHRLHLFSPGVTANGVSSADSRDRVDLFWADPLGKSTNDYNLYIVGPDGRVRRSSTTSHTGTQDPYQSVSGLSSDESIVITKSATAAPLFIHLDTGRAVLKNSTEGNVRGHNASGASNAFSVAAITALQPPGRFSTGAGKLVENFSSDGPRRMFFRPDGTPITPGNFLSNGGVVLTKPDFTAADGVSTSLPGDSGLNPFFGTSAAAPHAAAIAALLLSYDPTLTPEEARNILMKSSMLIDGDNPNNNAGAGIVMPFPALRLACLRKGSACPDVPGENEATANAAPVPQPETSRLRPR